MLFKFENLGPLRCAELELSNLTIICGKNNTGKTYATYTIYGFLNYWWEAYELNLEPSLISDLIERGTISLSTMDLLNKAQSYVDKACEQYNPMIYKILSSDEDTLGAASLEIILGKDDIKPLDEYDQTTGSDKINIFSIHKESSNDKIVISLLVDKEKIEIPRRILLRSISFAVKRIIFQNTFPVPFILVAERTGIEIFQSELDFARNRIIDTLKETKDIKNPIAILNILSSDYAMPIDRAVDFVRNIEKIIKHKSYIQNNYPDIINFLNNIIGGDFKYSKNVIQFIPDANKKIHLKMNESSTSVRSLVDLSLYLKHIAKKGDLLMIDEPELNLHPENQRKLMQLFALLVNAGINVYITTHSDYIVKELNNILLLSNLPDERKNLFYENYRYSSEQLLSPQRISIYLAAPQLIKFPDKTRRTRCNTLKRVDFSDYGFIFESFDETIDEMNKIQDLLLYGDD